MIRAWPLALALLSSATVARSQEDKPTAEPHRNHLVGANSPYLRQHADNPVDWYPWGEEAFAKAKREDKPIFLSIGYAACHWCHVMAHESFCDPQVAAYLNEHFVCVKVDREERPDVDELYMAAVTAMGQDGGWPLSVWLTPDRRPFYGGTYFPPQDQPGRPAFRRVLERLATVWHDRRDDVLGSAEELAKHLQVALAPAAIPGEPDAALLANVLAQSRARFDTQCGGFGEPPAFAPKFPSPSELRVLLRLEDAAALGMVTTTLRAMRDGGIYDQLGGGFHRYATDRRWAVPHFEKMLYDNALLVPCYLDAFVRTGDTDQADTAREVLDYLLRELRDAAGGFHASQDAQSEGVEGKYFVWTRAEVAALLGDDTDAACAWFGVREQGAFDGRNVLTRTAQGPAGDAVRRARAALLAARNRRVPPASDDKVLGAWNGLALDALAAGYRMLGDERYRAAAQEAAAFLGSAMVVDGRCRRSWRGGKVGAEGFLEDQAAVTNGLLSVFEIDGDPRWLAAAKSMLDVLVRDFGADDGGFWFTAAAGSDLLARSKGVGEGATPSGTALATTALLRGGLLLGDDALYRRGLAALRQAHATLAQAPAAAPALVLALQFHLGGPREVVVVGPPDDPRTKALLQRAYRSPAALVVANLHEGNRRALEAASPVFAGKHPVDGAPAAYVCRRGVCQAPITDPAELLR